MKTLSNKSAEKLQKILSKRLGRKLSQVELQEAYARLMEFATALLDLSSSSSDVFDDKFPPNRDKLLQQH